MREVEIKLIGKTFQDTIIGFLTATLLLTLPLIAVAQEKIAFFPTATAILAFITATVRFSPAPKTILTAICEQTRAFTVRQTDSGI